jgi:hypothetical protein
MLELEPEFPISRDGLRLTMHASYENSINMELLPVFFDSWDPVAKSIRSSHLISRLTQKKRLKVDRDNGQTPFINIFDARVASEDHRPIIKA